MVCFFFTIFATTFFLLCYHIHSISTMRKTNFLYKVYDLYAEGFRNMTLGKTLWAIILIKLFIMFVVLKLFFFPNYISQHAEEGEEAEYVQSEMMNRAFQDME